VLGLVLIALAVSAIVPVALGWIDRWAGIVAGAILGVAGVTLVARHIARHGSAGDQAPDR
jgi:hypothetical protein